MKVGPFYYYKNTIIAPENYQKQVDTATYRRELLGIGGYAGEHRDIWDNHMLLHYPELKIDYDDDHKALPRGRVDFTVKNNRPTFFITIDKCITGQECRIKQIYQLSGYSVIFHYGAMNYCCKQCI